LYGGSGDQGGGDLCHIRAKFGAWSGALSAAGQDDCRRAGRPGQLDEGSKPPLQLGGVEVRIIHRADVALMVRPGQGVVSAVYCGSSAWNAGREV
jgi:hypothetical protein